MISRLDQHVRVERPGGAPLNLGVIGPLPARAVVPPSKPEQGWDGARAERMTIWEAIDHDRVRKPDVPRLRTGSDGGEKLLDAIQVRAPIPVRLPVEDVPAVEERRAVQTLHPCLNLPGSAVSGDTRQRPQLRAGDAGHDRAQRRMSRRDRRPLREARSEE